MRRAALGTFLLLALACSSTPTGTLVVTTGGEGDAMTKQPAPTSLVVTLRSSDTPDKETELARVALPANGSISLPDQSKSSAGSIVVRALDATNKVLVGGETLFFQFGALDGASLEVFVQRTGELARMPRPPAALDQPLTDVVLGRYLVQASGTATTIYDLLFLQPLSTFPTLPRAAKSLATYSTYLVSIDENGLTTFDLSSGATADLSAPNGGTYAEIAGGLTVSALDSSAYVVGATRAAGPTPRVLRIDTSGNVSFAALANARAGACATWVEGRGLVVIGGDPKAPGVEILSAAATTAASLAYPPDPVSGCGAATLDGNHVVVAGGTGAASDTARVYDLSCTANCAPAPWVGSIPLARAQGQNVSADGALFVGDDAQGATHVWRASPTEAHEVPLKVARRGARMTLTPLSTIAVVGGAADIESYRE